MLRLNCGPPLAAGFLIIRWLRDVLPDAPGLLLGRAKAFRVPFSVCFRPFTPPWLPLRHPRRHLWALGAGVDYTVRNRLRREPG